MRVEFSTDYQQSFQAKGARRGARNIKQVMEKLYESAYQNELFEHFPDIIQISAKMHDGTEVSGTANFINGRYEGISFPYEWAHYRNEFCKAIIDKYNFVITKGKSAKK